MMLQLPCDSPEEFSRIQAGTRRQLNVCKNPNTIFKSYCLALVQDELNFERNIQNDKHKKKIYSWFGFFVTALYTHPNPAGILSFSIPQQRWPLSSYQQRWLQIIGLDLLSPGACSPSLGTTHSDQSENSPVVPSPVGTLTKKISPQWVSDPESPFFASKQCYHRPLTSCIPICQTNISTSLLSP